MKTQLIMLPQPILVSDEEVKEGDWFYHSFTNHIRQAIQIKNGNVFVGLNKDKSNYILIGCKKIIAGIPELPSIDFSALSEEDCKKIGWVDVDKLADKYSNFERASKWGDVVRNAYKEGFKTEKTLNEKKFSEDDMRKAIDMARIIPDHLDRIYKQEEIVNILLQPKVFDVEVQRYSCPEKPGVCTLGCIGKCSIKIIKVS